MIIILASNNKGKIKEIQKLFNHKVIAFGELLGDIDIPETGSSFKENAIIKARFVYDLIKTKNLIKEDFIVISDDSGISVDALDNKPNIYSARFAKVGASDEENNAKLVYMLKQKELTSSPAHYSAAICAISKDNIYTTHGFMYGDVFLDPKGDNGFGYDPLFQAKGYKLRVAQLSSEQKQQISHRAKALKLMKILLKDLD